MSDSEKTPILRKSSDSPVPPTVSDSPVLDPTTDSPPVTAPSIEDSGVVIGSHGYMTRETFKSVYTLLSILYGLLNVGVWVSLALTLYYLEGTSGYFGAVIGLASQMIIPVIQCASIASRVSSVGYKHAARLGLKTLVNIHLCVLVLQLASSLACVGVSATYGIRYGKNGEKVTNKDTNMGVGILNVSIASVIAIVTVVTLYLGVKLRKSLIMANVNSGPFATDGSYSA